jgi:hypothetical protein
MAFDQGAPSFGLNDLKIQTWSSAGTYSGTITDVMSAQMANVTMQMISAILNGDDSITAAAARAIGGEQQMRWGGVSMSALAVMTGKAVTTISSVNQLQIAGGDRMPYFGVIAKALVEEGGGAFWVYLPKVKIMSNFTLVQMEYGAFAIPEVTCQLVDDASYGVINLIADAANIDVTVMPPANIAVVS